MAQKKDQKNKKTKKDRKDKKNKKTKKGRKKGSTREGRLTPRVHIVCRLAEILRERGLTGQRLHEIAGVSEDTITKLRKGTWRNVRRRVLERIAGALSTNVHDLFVTRPADIWFPIRRHRRVTVHFGSTSMGLLEGPEAVEASGGEEAIDRQFIGVWDQRAFAHVYNYLADTSVGSIHYEFREHEIGGAGNPPTRDDFRSGNHIVFGSPVVNPFAERAVCYATGLPPRTPARASEFAFNFRWRSKVTVSSFGSRSDSNALGIIDTRSQELIAERTVVSQGAGDDCGLIMTYRFSPPERRAGDEDDDCIIIVIMGQSGCGTLASAQLLCNREEAARALYPQKRDLAVFRVCKASYMRELSPVGHDNRVVTSASLVPEPAGEN
jgi:DNA-binding Xre family transcriptional regulator